MRLTNLSAFLEFSEKMPLAIHSNTFFYKYLHYLFQVITGLIS